MPIIPAILDMDNTMNHIINILILYQIKISVRKFIEHPYTINGGPDCYTGQTYI